MSEPLRTESLRVSTVHEDRFGQPFEGSKRETYASLGKFSDSYSIARRKFFGQVVDSVKPIIPQFEKISGSHGRSMTETATSKKLVWGGNLPGDIYGARTIKGTYMPIETDVHYKIRHAQYTTYPVGAYGLMDDACIPRIIKASKLMREHGLPTECPRAVKKLKEVYVKKGKNSMKISIKDWEKGELDFIKKTNEYNLPDKVPEIGDVEKYLRETDFVALERDVQVDERIKDLKTAIHENKFRELMEPIFKWLNAATQAKNSGLIPGTPKLETFSYTESDLTRYFQDFLPSQMGIYLAKFHKLDLCHGFLHDQNWSLVGTIYDLDSVRGELLYSDDKPPTKSDFINDLSYTNTTLCEMFFALSRYVGPQAPWNIEKVQVVGIDNFCRSYFTEKYGADFAQDQLNNEEVEFLKHHASWQLFSEISKPKR